MGFRWTSNKEREIQGYKRRVPEETELYRLVMHHYEELEQEWEESFQQYYGSFRSEIRETFESYLECGVLRHGCIRLHCKSCNHSELLAFSCRKRGVCPSCATKRALIFAEHIESGVLEQVPHSHVVFSIPKRLRCYFRYNRKLHNILFQATWESIKELFEEVVPSGIPGGVLALQTFGDDLGYNPHIHSIITAGAYLESGSFVEIPYVKSELLRKLFEHKVLKELIKEELITPEVVEQLQSQIHTGFSGYWGEPIEASDVDSRKFLAKYIDRGGLSLERLSIYEDLVEYKTKDGVLKEFYPTEFLARLSAHIPDKYESLVRYMGCYSSRYLGERNKKKSKELTEEEKALAEELISEFELPEKKVVSSKWRSLIQKVYHVDPLVCPKCGSEMNFAAFMTDSSEIKRIMDNLKIEEPRSPPPIRTASTFAPEYDDLEYASDYGC